MIIYVIAPYTIGNLVENIRRACLAGDEILKKGHIPFIPHQSIIWDLISPKSWEEWLRIDFAYLSMCDAALRLTGESKGGDREEVEAKKLCMIIYHSIDEVPDNNIKERIQEI